MITTNSKFEELYPLSQKIIRSVGKAIVDYNMIHKDDSIMIGLSGGKDSLLLSLALSFLNKRSPVKFKLHACMVDQSDGAVNADSVKEYMDILGIETTIVKHSTFEIIKIRDERSPCSLCANFRRGILASEAEKHGCNLIALGHHKDDAAETVMLNLFYEGRFKCFHPNMYMTKSKKTVIRPLVYVEERQIILESERLKLPITSFCCPYGAETKRKSVKDLIKQMEIEYPSLKSNVIHALENIRESDVWTKESI